MTDQTKNYEVKKKRKERKKERKKEKKTVQFSTLFFSSSSSRAPPRTPLSPFFFFFFPLFFFCAVPILHKYLSFSPSCWTNSRPCFGSGFVLPMVKTSKSIHEHFEDDANESGVKIEGKSGESKASGHRSKHSETEQRRRSKINERFQILRELIPQNDQKRDKASFLLEVIEYIQFLQEKLNMYEGSCRGWSSDPSKLMPWKNYRAADSYTDHSQVVKRGPNHESAIVFSQAMLTNAPNVMDADLGPAALLNAVDHTLVSATQGLPMSMHTQPIVFDLVGRSSLSTESLDEPVSGSENVSSKTQAELLPGRTCTTTGFLNHAVSDQDDLTPESELESISGAYSHGLLSTLTQALQASGVDLSQTNISVKVDVGKRANRAISLSEDDKKQSLNNQLMGQSIHGCFSEESEQTHKKLRTGV